MPPVSGHMNDEGSVAAAAAADVAGVTGLPMLCCACGLGWATTGSSGEWRPLACCMEAAWRALALAGPPAAGALYEASVIISKEGSCGSGRGTM